jgi:phosphatidylserine decarboxylase
VSPPTIHSVRSWQYQDDAPALKIGDEVGRFNMGSTIIVLFGQHKMQWETGFKAGKTVRLGELIGRTLG